MLLNEHCTERGSNDPFKQNGPTPSDFWDSDTPERVTRTLDSEFHYVQVLTYSETEINLYIFSNTSHCKKPVT
jgi:hypothetical protein